MTGAYLRVYRDGKWQNIEVEHLSEAELMDAMKHREKEEIIRWLHMVCRTVAHMDDAFNAGQGA